LQPVFPSTGQHNLLQDILTAFGASKKTLQYLKKVQITRPSNRGPCGALTVLMIRKYCIGTVWDRVPRELVKRIAFDVWLDWLFSDFGLPVDVLADMACLEFLWKALTIDPRKRPNASELLQTDYMR
jgi:hypothetical protein